MNSSIQITYYCINDSWQSIKPRSLQVDTEETWGEDGLSLVSRECRRVSTELWEDQCWCTRPRWSRTCDLSNCSRSRAPATCWETSGTRAAGYSRNHSAEADETRSRAWRECPWTFRSYESTSDTTPRSSPPTPAFIIKTKIYLTSINFISAPGRKWLVLETAVGGVKIHFINLHGLTSVV